MTRSLLRSNLMAAGAASVIAAVGLGVTGMVGHGGIDVAPWNTSHAVTADGGPSGKVTLQPFSIMKKVDVSSARLF
jgi:hypothetical protein